MDQTSSMEELSQLVDRLKEAYGLNGDKEQQKTAQKYVIYVRKSTESAEKQERSIGDQLHVCRDLAYRLGLKVVGVLEEEKSAKISGLRDRFDEMLKGVHEGKYEGIIVWSPDRLARNMKEAGEVIDLLDKGVIKDIKFANGHAFTNEPSGKMLLGIAFVMAKQYSDQHSQNVKRSVNRITQEGKFLISRNTATIRIKTASRGQTMKTGIYCERRSRKEFMRRSRLKISQGG